MVVTYTEKGREFDFRRVVRVRDSSEFTIKINKTCISAIGGARGLFCFLNDNIEITDLFSCWKDVVIREFPI